MALNVNGTKLKRCNVNGVKCKHITVNGVNVWNAEEIFYDRGTVHEDLGGLAKSGSGNATTPVLWIYTGDTDAANGKTAFIRSAEKIDVTYLDVIHFECFGNRSNCRVGIDKGILSGYWAYPEYEAMMPNHENASIETSKTESSYFGNVDLDVSSATGEYYLYLCIAYSKNATARTRKVWAE